MNRLNRLSTAIAVLLIPSLLLSQQPMAGAAAFKIEVLDGEDGVNIIKKKTAVKPVVQVKDKNDLPIAGVAVVIALGAAGVFSDGAHSAAVVTNAQGIAASPEFQPLVKGPFEVSVRATYQGHTVTATIHQTNFMTNAAALKAGKTPGSSSSSSQASTGSQASQAGQSSMAAASGGGHGLLILGVVAGVGAAAVGGAYAAGLLGKNNNTPGTASCTTEGNQAVAAQTATLTCEGNNTSDLSVCNQDFANLVNASNAYCSCIDGAEPQSQTFGSILQSADMNLGLGYTTTCH